jgi:hypothetical protein
MLEKRRLRGCAHIFIHRPVYFSILQIKLQEVFEKNFEKMKNIFCERIFAKELENGMLFRYNRIVKKQEKRNENDFGAGKTYGLHGQSGAGDPHLRSA